LEPTASLACRWHIQARIGSCRISGSPRHTVQLPAPSVDRRSQRTAFASRDGYIFRDITLRSLLKRNTKFRGNMLPPSSWSKDEPSSASYSLENVSSTLKTETKCFSETSVDLQRTELFLVRSNACVPVKCCGNVPPCSLVNCYRTLRKSKNKRNAL
jgi:hypothetical protein